MWKKNVRNSLAERVDEFIAQAEHALAFYGNGTNDSLLLQTYFDALQLARVAKLYDERYVTFTEIDRNEVHLKLFCLDPSCLLRQTAKNYRCGIYFSATLSPVSFYMDMLGGDAADYSVSIPSPFSPSQLEVTILPLSTRYRDREKSKEPIAELLRRMLAEKPGNYLVFFPSYEYMNGVYEQYMAKNSDADTLIQSAQMPEEARESFLAAFDAENRRPLSGFAVMGGIFSEGIDLVGDRLTGVVVVGVGLPQISFERNIIKDYFNGKGRNGYDYAYVFPGMNKVQQAGGRLIRSETDRGHLVLIDDRYMQQQYRQLLPKEWAHYQVMPLPK